MGKLTAVKVRNEKRPGRYADGGGLYLLVRPERSKSWVLHVVVNGRRRDYGLGGVDLVPLAEARDKALEGRRVAKGGPTRACIGSKPQRNPHLSGSCRAIPRNHQNGLEERKAFGLMIFSRKVRGASMVSLSSKSALRMFRPYVGSTTEPRTRTCSSDEENEPCSAFAR